MFPGPIRSVVLCALAVMCMAQQCDKGKAGADPLAALTTGTWNLATLGGKAIDLPEGVRTPTLQVGPDMAVSGFGGCNRFSGKASMENGAIAFPGIMRTKMFCAAAQPLEEGFMAALNAANAFKVDGGTLRLLDKDRELATLVRP